MADSSTSNISEAKRKARETRDKAVRTPFGSLEDWRIYVVLGVSVVAIGGLILSNVINSVKGSTTVSCVQTMAMFTLALEEMDQEIGFDMNPAEAGDAAVMRAILNYFTYGEAGFEHDDGGELIRPLHPLPSSQTQSLTRVEREHFDIGGLPPCTKGGVYHFETPAGGRGGVPEVLCSEHGRLGRPDSHGRYTFDGRLRDLEPSETSMGFVATLFLPAKFKPSLEQIAVVAAGAPPPPQATPDNP